MTPEEFNAQFQGYGNEAYQGWKSVVAKVATHPATALAIFIVVAAVFIFAI